MNRCKECSEWLIPLGGMYVHPELPCKEEDGVQLGIIDEDVNRTFQDKYGIPDMDFNQLLKTLLNEIEEQKKEISKLKKTQEELKKLKEKKLVKWFYLR